MLIGNTVFLPEATLTLYDNLEFCIRILLAGVLGGLIGLERTKRQKDAGIRTHCIIAVASATFMVLSKYAFMDMVVLTDVLGGKGADPSRIASQVVTGISFLGAGVIFKNEKMSVKGLTTAAGVWGTAAIGMAVGAGLYWVSVFTTGVLVLIQWIFHRFPVGNDFYSEQCLTVRMKDEDTLRSALRQIIELHSGEIIEAKLVRCGEDIIWKLSVRIVRPITCVEADTFMREHEGVKHISV